MPLAKLPPAIGERLAVSGFASTRRHALTHLAGCRVERADARLFIHSCAAGPGHSGGPVYGWSLGQRVAFGVHTASGGLKGLAVAGARVRDGQARRPY